MISSHLRFPKSYRLRSKADFSSIRKGKRIRVGNLRIVYRSNKLEHCRLGLAVSRKYGNAVQRNRLKRQLRNTFRISECHTMGVDMLIIPACNADQMRSAANDLMRAIDSIQRRLKS
ncbi:MAG: ribonuclease P protein component [Mariprofundus sp.]